jgi:hypothetical protein
LRESHSREFCLLGKAGKEYCTKKMVPPKKHRQQKMTRAPRQAVFGYWIEVITGFKIAISVSSVEGKIHTP